MKYTRFEILAFLLGTVAVIASIAIRPTASPQAAEIAAQLLLILVLAGALHWGRNGGFLAALVAIAVYVAMRYPLLEAEGLSNDLLTMLGGRAATYALIGIVGGEIASRIKYVFVKFENEILVDDYSGVFSPRYAAGAILSGVGQWERYKTDFAVLRLVIDPAIYSTLKPRSRRQLMRQVAAYARNDIRMVDDVAAQEPGTFIVMLPRTDAAGARVVLERLNEGLRGLLGAQDGSITASALTASTDAQALKNLADSLCPTGPAAIATVLPRDDSYGAAAE